MMEWCTSRSMAAAVVIGSLKIWSHWLKTRLELISRRAALVALGQQREEHFHFLAALLDVADVVEDQHVEAVELLEFGFEPQVALGG
jgi:regulator of sigma D